MKSHGPARSKALKTRSTAGALTRDQIVELAEIFHLLGDVTRLRITFACLEGPISVGALAARLELSQTLVSHHLRLLRGGRILKAERFGKEVHYSPDDSHIRDVLSDMAAHIVEASGA